MNLLLRDGDVRGSEFAAALGELHAHLLASEIYFDGPIRSRAERYLAAARHAVDLAPATLRTRDERELADAASPESEAVRDLFATLMRAERARSSVWKAIRAGLYGESP